VFSGGNRGVERTVDEYFPPTTHKAYAACGRAHSGVLDFFLIESNCRVRRQSSARRTNGRSGRAARQRQRPSDSQYRYGFRPTFPL